MIEAFLSREPLPEYQNQVAMAQFFSDYVSSHGGGKIAMERYLPYENAWPKEQAAGEYSELDLEIMGGIK